MQGGGQIKRLRCLSFIQNVCHHTSPAFYPLSWTGYPHQQQRPHRSIHVIAIDSIYELAAPKVHSRCVTTPLVGSCPTFSPLPSPVSEQGGCFLLHYLAVTDHLYIGKWDALRCPDFPLVLGRGTAPSYSTSDKPSDCFQDANLHIFFDSYDSLTLKNQRKELKSPSQPSKHDYSSTTIEGSHTRLGIHTHAIGDSFIRDWGLTPTRLGIYFSRSSVKFLQFISKGKMGCVRNE